MDKGTKKEWEKYLKKINANDLLQILSKNEEDFKNEMERRLTGGREDLRDDILLWFANYVKEYEIEHTFLYYVEEKGLDVSQVSKELDSIRSLD